MRKHKPINTFIVFFGWPQKGFFSLGVSSQKSGSNSFQKTRVGIMSRCTSIWYWTVHLHEYLRHIKNIQTSSPVSLGDVLLKSVVMLLKPMPSHTLQISWVNWLIGNVAWWAPPGLLARQLQDWLLHGSIHTLSQKLLGKVRSVCECTRWTKKCNNYAHPIVVNITTSGWA